MSNKWNRPNRKPRNWGNGFPKTHYPAGLKGKQIGMYFRGLQMKKKKKELVINLTIPSSVLTAVETNLQNITKIAVGQNISLSQEKLDSFKNNLNNLKKPNSEIPKVMNEFSLLYAEGDNKKSMNDSVSSEGPSNSELYKNTIKTENSHENEESCQPGPSNAPEFIPINIKTDPEYYSEPKLNTLRKPSEYKYGYEDIITGTFEEKLDECLEKRSISLANSEIENLNMALFIEYQDMLQKRYYKSMMKFREKLPTYQKAKNILDVINNTQVVVISGETGCGKSTQVPQLILDEAICAKKGANVKILVTQPRRIAASSLAIRVSKERGEDVGNSVGYSVRLERVPERARGSIKYCTTGILLAELEVNQGLMEYSHIILDEVHERDVHVDLSMCMLKQVLKKRKDLKLILMSATLDAENLSSYFDNCPLMHIEGLAYPVEDIYLEDILELTKYKLPPEKFKAPQPHWKKYQRKNKSDDMQRDIIHRAEISSWLESKRRDMSPEVYRTLQDARIENLNIDLILQLLIYICKGEEGAILVFLPGIGEITKLMKAMQDSNHFPSSCYEIYPLHSKLPTLEQHKIFERPRKGVRKIIIATNIAETSITIDDIVYVVDCGKIKITGLNIEENIQTLQIQWVSQANLRQRRGRAGRCQPGICYHLLTSYRGQQIPERMLPELQRSNLLEPVLNIKKLRLGLAAEALKLVPSPPAESTIQWAVNHLQKCGALYDNETLTPLGWHLARLPVHPAAGKLLLFGALFGCLDRAASVAAVWGFKDPFMLVIGKENQIDAIKRDFAIGEPSDHITIAEAILEWEKQPQRLKRSYAYDNFLSNNTLELLSGMKQQLGDNLRQMGFLATGELKSSWENRNTNNLSLFKAIVAAALYPNIAYVRWKNLNSGRKPATFTACSPEDGRVSIHPSSIMTKPKNDRYTQLCSNPGANWLVYWMKQKTSELYLLEVTLIYTLPLLFFGEFVVTDDYLTQEEENCLISISSVKVRCNRETAEKIFDLRSFLDKVLASKITDSTEYSLSYNKFDEQVINSVIELITAEDEQVEYLNDEFPDSDTSEG